VKDVRVRGYIISVGFIFALTALAKLVSATGNARILDLGDPLLGPENRLVLTGVGTLEAGVAIFLFIGRTRWLQLSLTAWMASNFLVYRLALWWTDAPKPCGCLGTVTDALPLSPRMVDYGMKGILAYLFIGSIFFLSLQMSRSSECAAGGSVSDVSA